MKDWKEIYSEKLCTAEEAVKNIKSGDHVVIGHCAAEPAALVDAMIANASAYQNVTIHNMYTLSEAKYAAEELRKNFFLDTWYVCPATKKAVAGGWADVTVNNFYQVPDFIKKGIFSDDVAMITVSKPNAKGFVSLGVSVDYTRTAVDNAKIVIAQVNANMPFTYGDTMLHVSELDFIVEADQPLYTVAPAEPSEAEKKIAETVASLIEDGSTVSMAAGILHDELTRALSGKKNLKIVSDVLTDGMMELYENGCIDGKMIVSYALGSEKLYDFVDENAAVEFRPADYVNHPFTLSALPDFVGISTSQQIDIVGHVMSGCSGTDIYAGGGGQAGQIRGADGSHDQKGRAIIAMTATHTDSEGNVISNILPVAPQAMPVSTPSEEAPIIVTEYGWVDMRAMASEDRAQAMISMAAPEFREELAANYELRFKKKLPQ